MVGADAEGRREKESEARAASQVVGGRRGDAATARIGSLWEKYPGKFSDFEH